MCSSSAAAQEGKGGREGGGEVCFNFASCTWNLLEWTQGWEVHRNMQVGSVNDRTDVYYYYL